MFISFGSLVVRYLSRLHALDANIDDKYGLYFDDDIHIDIQKSTKQYN